MKTNEDATTTDKPKQYYRLGHRSRALCTLKWLSSLLLDHRTTMSTAHLRRYWQLAVRCLALGGVLLVVGRLVAYLYRSFNLRDEREGWKICKHIHRSSPKIRADFSSHANLRSSNHGHFYPSQAQSKNSTLPTTTLGIYTDTVHPTRVVQSFVCVWGWTCGSE